MSTVTTSRWVLHVQENDGTTNSLDITALAPALAISGRDLIRRDRRDIDHDPVSLEATNSGSAALGTLEWDDESVVEIDATAVEPGVAAFYIIAAIKDALMHSVSQTPSAQAST